MTITRTCAGTPNQAALLRVRTEVVIFAIRDDHLQVLLLPFDDEYAGSRVRALPGDSVRVCEPVDECAVRALREQTGLTDVYLEQLYTFGEPDGLPGEQVIAVAYYALVSRDRQEAVDAGYPGAWHAVDSLPELCAGHGRIIRAARERLQAKLEYSTIAFQLMPESFTLSELQQVYEAICGRRIDKRNFRKRVLALDHVEATDRKRRNGSHRPARLYRYTAREAIHYLK